MVKIIILLLSSIVIVLQANRSNRSFFDFKALIDKVNEKGASWTAGHNSNFDDMDIDTIKGMMGTL